MRGTLKSSVLLSYLLEDIQDTPASRAEIAGFLANSEGRPCPESLWLKRMDHWWSENPAAGAHPARGCGLRHEGALVGFMACIPSQMAWQGAPVPALFPVSWRVAAEHRSASLPMLVRMRTLGRQATLLDTSPRKDVQVMLDKLGFRSVTERSGLVFVLGSVLGRLFGRGRAFPSLTSGRHVVTDVNAVTSIARPFMQPDRLENWTTPEFLRWRVNAPLFKLRFLGCIDKAGMLTSYLIFAGHEIKKRPAWLVVDWFTTEPGIDEVLALLGELSRQPALLGESRRLVEAAVFEPERSLWEQAPWLLNLTRPATYCYMTPPALSSSTKRCVLADGDYGM